jgi:hypothetical protein
MTCGKLCQFARGAAMESSQLSGADQKKSSKILTILCAGQALIHDAF